jgi:hypothetical protein
MEPEKQKRPRGTGMIFQNGRTKILSVKYYDHGRCHRESTHSTDPAVAERLLKRRLSEITCDVFIPRQNIKMAELMQDVFDDYRAQALRSIEQAKARWRNHLAE